MIRENQKLFLVYILHISIMFISLKQTSVSAWDAQNFPDCLRSLIYQIGFPVLSDTLLCCFFQTSFSVFSDRLLFYQTVAPDKLCTVSIYTGTIITVNAPKETSAQPYVIPFSLYFTLSQIQVLLCIIQKQHIWHSTCYGWLLISLKVTKQQVVPVPNMCWCSFCCCTFYTNSFHALLWSF